MNYKSLTIIALALCLCIAVPVSAMWNNGNWVPDNANDGYKVHLDPKTGVTSKYRDMNPVNEIKASENGNGGIAVGSIRAGFSTLSNTIYVRNVLQPANTSPMVIAVYPDATFRIPAAGDGVLAPGEYEATLDNFNLPDETVKFTIAANQQGPTRIGDFIGQAASAYVCNPFYTIIDATYGAGASHEETVHHGDYTREWVAGYCARYWHGMCVDYRPGHYDYDYVGMGNGDYIKVRHHGCNEYQYIAPTQETVIDGTVIDVTSNVQTAVGLGAIEFMFFDNAQNPGGIFGAGNVLLSEIKDPAPGIVKSVYIKYNDGCGLDRTIKTMEYCNINLVSGSAKCPSQETPN